MLYRLADFKVPKLIHMVSFLPKNAMGKVRCRAYGNVCSPEKTAIRSTTSQIAGFLKRATDLFSKLNATYSYNFWIPDCLQTEGGEQRISSAAGVPTLGLDALSSAAYGPEAALTVLLPLGTAGLTLIFPITVAIVVLLGIVYAKLSANHRCVPERGRGRNTVARENLGANAGLLAAAALMTDYVLNVAVGISACVGALISALPALQPYTLTLCLLILILLTFVNLRGIREAGVLFTPANLCLRNEPLHDYSLGVTGNDFLGRASASGGSAAASRQGYRSRGRVGAAARVRQLDAPR